MIGHKPECPANWGVGEMPEGPCTFCEMLSACEQRVREEDQRSLIKYGVQMFKEGKEYGRQTAYAAGLDAAREALDALPTEQTVKEGVSEFWVEINHAIAAIDALREKPLASGGIYAGPPIPLGDGCVIPKSDAIDALREKP